MPELQIDPALAVNLIVHRHPQMMPLLATAGIDTCCGGAESLHDAARMAGADLGTLLTAMRAELLRAPADDVLTARGAAGVAR